MPGDYSSNQLEISWFDIVTQDGEIIFDGSTAYGTAPAGSNWGFPGAFTIELFGVRFDNNTTRQHLLSTFLDTGDQRGLLCRFSGDATPKNLLFAFSTDGTDGTQQVITEDFSPTPDQKYDITFERDGSDNLRIYVDGAMLGKTAASGTVFQSNQDLHIARSPHSSGDLSGALSTIRFTKGTARYADDGGYTVPDLPLPTS